MYYVALQNKTRNTFNGTWVSAQPCLATWCNVELFSLHDYGMVSLLVAIVEPLTHEKIKMASAYGLHLEFLQNLKIENHSH
jgi:hypothetical protein